MASIVANPVPTSYNPMPCTAAAIPCE